MDHREPHEPIPVLSYHSPPRRVDPWYAGGWLLFWALASVFLTPCIHLIAAVPAVGTVLLALWLIIHWKNRSQIVYVSLAIAFIDLLVIGYLLSARNWIF